MTTALKIVEPLNSMDGAAVRPLSEDGEFAKASAKYRRIRERSTELAIELREIETQIARQFVDQNKIGDETDMHARRIVDEDLGDVGKPFPEFEALAQRAARLRAHLAAYGKARAMQRATLDEIKSERSIDAAEILRSEHRAAVGGIAAAIASLRSAIENETRIRDQLISAGYDARLPTFNPGIDLRPAPASPIGNLERKALTYAEARP